MNTKNDLFVEAGNLLKNDEKKFFKNYYFLIFISYLYFLFLLLFAFLCAAIAIGSLTYRISYVAVFFGAIFIYIFHDFYTLLFNKNKQREKNPYVINRKHYPKFDQVLSELEGKLDVKVKKIILGTEHDAYADSRPYVLSFGQRNVLSVGLPLLLLGSSEQIKWILAHELGHMSRRHGLITQWSYRTYYSLLHLYDVMGQRRRTSLLIKPFFSRVWPKLSSAQFVLGRRFEFDVDKDATSFVGKEAGMSALLNLPYGLKSLDIFFGEFLKLAKTNSEVPLDIYEKLLEFSKQKNIFVEAILKVEERLLQETDNFDTHPALKDRLEAIQGSVFDKDDIKKWIKPFNSSAFEELFADETILKRLSLVWKEQYSSAWKSAHDKYKEIQDLKHSYEESRDIKLLQRIASDEFSLEGFEYAKATIAELEKLDQNNITALILNLRNAAQLRNEKQTLHFAEKLISADVFLTEVACDFLYGLYVVLGKKEEANLTQSRVVSFREEYAKYAAKMDSFKKGEEVWVANTLTTNEIDLIKESVKKFRVVKEVFVVDKKIGLLGVESQLVLVFVPFRFLLDRTRRLNHAMEKVISKISPDSRRYFSNCTAVPVLGKNFSWIRKELRQPENAFTSIYRNKRLFLVEQLCAWLAISLVAVALSLLLVILNRYDGSSDLTFSLDKHYKDPVTGINLTVEDRLGWRIETTYSDSQWYIIALSRILDRQDVRELSNSSLYPDLVKQDGRGISFVKIHIVRHIALNDANREYFKTDEALSEFHDGEILPEYVNKNIVEKSNQDIRKTIFLGHKALSSTGVYENTKYGTRGKNMVTSFMVDGILYSVEYVGPEPLYSKYLMEANSILGSLKIN